MKLRWLAFAPLFGMAECTSGRTYVLVEVEGAVTDSECVNGFFVQDEFPIDVWFSCEVDPEAPVDSPEPEVRCHPSGDVGLRISPKCTLDKDGVVEVEVELELLSDGCETGTLLDPASVVVVPEEFASGFSQGGSVDDWPACSIFGPPQDGTGWILVNAIGYAPE